MNVIDWLLVLVGKEGLNVPEWFDEWFLALGIINCIIFLLYTVISQFSYSYLITDKNIYIRGKILFFYNSITVFTLHELVNVKTQFSYLGKVMRYGNILPITEINLEVKPKVNFERGVYQKIFQIIKLLIFHKRVKKDLMMNPSECLFGVKNPMAVYELANELMDNNNVEIEI